MTDQEAKDKQELAELNELHALNSQHASSQEQIPDAGSVTQPQIMSQPPVSLLSQLQEKYGAHPENLVNTVGKALNYPVGLAQVGVNKASDMLSGLAGEPTKFYQSGDLGNALMGNAPQNVYSRQGYNPSLDIGYNAASQLIAPSAMTALVGKVAPYIGKGIQHGINIVAGVPKTIQDAYLADSEGVNAAKPFSDILSNSRDKLSEIQNNTKDTQAALQDVLNKKKIDLPLAQNEAKQAYQNQYNALKEVQKPTDIANDIYAGLQKVRGDVTQGSANALETLQSGSGNIPSKDIASVFLDEANKLNWNGQQIGLPGSQGIQQTLRDYARQILESGDMVEAGEVKKILKEIDDRTSGSYGLGAAEFNPADVQRLKSSRAGIDTILKQANPDYASAMGPVANKTSLLSDLGERFGSPEQAASTVSSIRGPRGPFDVELLKRLETELGTPGSFTGPIDKYTSAKDILESPTAMQNLKESLPESQFAETLRGLLEKQQMEAQGNLSSAQQAAEPYAGMSPDTIETQLRAIQNRGRNQNITKSEKADELSRLAGYDIVKELERNGIQNSLSKDRTNGSRSTLLGGAMGGAIGYATGSPATDAAIGSMVGAGLDKYGGSLTKAGLDMFLKLQQEGIPVQKAYEQIPTWLKLGVRQSDSVNRGEGQ